MPLLWEVLHQQMDMVATVGTFLSVYDRLYDVLLNGRSFAQIGASHFPHMLPADAAKIVLAQFVLALELLSELNAQPTIIKNAL